MLSFSFAEVSNFDFEVDYIPWGEKNARSFPLRLLCIIYELLALILDPLSGEVMLVKIDG